MAQFGSGRSIIAQNQSAVTDPNGNLIVSPDNGFGGSPLGVAARTQALYGIPNANFDVLPSDPYSAITVSNPLPYWDTAINGLGTATMVYTDATQSWAVRLDPTAGTASGESITLKARTYLLNDSNLTLRQKAFASITKVGTQATSEWDLVLSATYYDEAGTQLSTYNIGTANSGTTWTTINGFTTSGTAAIDPAAHYADLALTLTTSGSVSGTAMVDINSLLIQTSTGAAGAQSFIITETFTSSGTWTRPTGVDYVSVAIIGGGNGGDGGSSRMTNSTTTVTNRGGRGGHSGQHLIVRDIYVGDVPSVAIGVGAGGSGGSGGTATKSAGGTFVSGTTYDPPGGGGGWNGDGATGGASSFGSYVVTRTVAQGGTAVPIGPADTSIAYGYDLSTWAIGGTAAGQSASTAFTPAPGSATFGGGRTIVPLQNVDAGTSVVVAGGTGYYTTTTGGSGWGYTFVSSAAGSVGTGLSGSGAGGGGAANKSGTANAVSNGGSAAGTTGGGPGGGAGWLDLSFSSATAARTVVVYGGPGGNGGFGGSGGGGGGPAWMKFSNVGTAIFASSTLQAIGGDGGDGSDGYVVVSYVA
jgi:hypothetical protein